MVGNEHTVYRHILNHYSRSQAGPSWKHMMTREMALTLLATYDKVPFRIPLFNKYLDGLGKTDKRKVDEYGFWGLAWLQLCPCLSLGPMRGTIPASILGMNWKRAFCCWPGCGPGWRYSARDYSGGDQHQMRTKFSRTAKPSSKRQFWNDSCYGQANAAPSMNSQ